MTVVDDIKGRLDILDLVSGYVPLAKSGNSYKAACPFHSERTPSFHVFPERQSWRCFGACATGGDVFSFLMRIENLEFGEALKRLAQQAGVALAENPGRRKEQDSLYQVNEAACEFFSDVLASTRRGSDGREYLDKRGVAKDAIDRFQIGLSPAGGEPLSRHLASKGYTEDVLAMAGLVTKGQGDTYRDLFRGRLMFPIRDASGSLAGFGGRTLDGSQPKYLNSPKTSVFDKSNILYALHLAKDSAAEQGIVIVEGYMDAVGCHQGGFSNVVASMGTALTPQQVSLICNLLRRSGASAPGRITLALDADAAGQEATLRGLQVLWDAIHQGKGGSGSRPYASSEIPSIRVVVLPDGQDPDEVILKDPQAWATLVEEALPLLDYRFAAESAKVDVSTPQGKAALAEKLLPLVAATPDPFQQDYYFQKLASLLGVSEATLLASVGRPQVAAGPQQNRRSRTPQQGQEASTAAFARLDHDPLEEHCLALLLQEHDWMVGGKNFLTDGDDNLLEAARGLGSEHFARVENREVFTNWTKCSTLEVLRDALDEELSAHLNHLLAKVLPPLDRKIREAALLDCIRRLEERHLRELKLEEGLRLNQATLDEIEEEQHAILSINERIKQVFRS